MVGGRFTAFPNPMPDSFALDMVPGLQGYSLIAGHRGDVDRFAIKTPNGRVLKPQPGTRRVQVRVNREARKFNVANLLASHILGEDVTDNEYAMLIDETGIWVESSADRLALVETMRQRCRSLPRVDLSIIAAPRSETIDVTGRGYYVERGTLYRSNGIPMSVGKNGVVQMTTNNGKNPGVHIGKVLFTAHPDIYRFDPAWHVEVDHINGDRTDNAAWNFRPVTRHQNMAACHCTGTRMPRPDDTSSHETFKRDTGPLTPTMTDTMITDDDLRQFETTCYWAHRRGAVFRRWTDGTFTYAAAFLLAGYVVSGSGMRHHHYIITKAFGVYDDGKVVMHLDDDKQNNRLENLRMGTHSENAWRMNAVTIHIPDQAPQTFTSECEAVRRTGIPGTTIRRNRGQQRPAEPLVYSTTRSGITFAATDPFHRTVP